MTTYKRPIYNKVFMGKWVEGQKFRLIKNPPEDGLVVELNIKKKKWRLGPLESEWNLERSKKEMEEFLEHWKPL